MDQRKSVKRIVQKRMRRYQLHFLCIIGIALLTSCASSCNKRQKGETMNSYTSVSMEEGLKMMEASPDFILLDVRRQDEYDGGHIPGARLLSNESINEESAAAILPDKEVTVYVYCRSGRRSKLASEKLAGYGYTGIIEIGGIQDYSGPLEK